MRHGAKVEQLKQTPVEWAAASRARSPAAESGDAFLVRAAPNVALVAVVDGLGHGAAAATAARLALTSITDAGDPVAVVERCHDALRSTRGVVLELARFDATRHLLTRIGVGSIQGVLLRSAAEAGPTQRMLFRQGGIVGRQLPPLRSEVLTVRPGDTLVLATDGIHHEFSESVVSDGPLQSMADRILADHWNGSDDGLVVAVRYKGGLP